MNPEQLSIEAFVDKLLRLRSRLAGRKDQPKSIRSWPDRFPSSESIRKLLKDCYFLSLEQYEGRNICTELIWNHPAVRHTYIHRFSPALRDFGAKTMRQLAQVADGKNGKLGLVYDGEHLALEGVTFCWPAFGQEAPGFAPGIIICIKGPGHIEYQEGYLVRAYRRGRSVRLRQLDRVPTIKQCLENMDGKLQEKAISKLRDHSAWKDCTETPLFPTGIAKKFLYSVISEIENRGHGGTVVILPESRSLETLIDIRFPARSNDLLWLVQKIGEESLFAQTHGYETDSIFSPELLNVRNGMANIQAFGSGIATLSGCDGAIVITRDADLLGFGGIIQPSNLSKSSPHKQRSRGARHTSAEWICESVPGAIAIVVSADRGVTLIHSSDGPTKVLTDLVVR